MVCGIDLESEFAGKGKVNVKMRGILDAISKYKTDQNKRRLMDMSTDRLRSMGLSPDDIHKILKTITDKDGER